MYMYLNSMHILSYTITLSNFCVHTLNTNLTHAHRWTHSQFTHILMGVCIHMHEGYITPHKAHIHTHAPLHVHTPLKLKLQFLSLKSVQKKSSYLDTFHRTERLSGGPG